MMPEVSKQHPTSIGPFQGVQGEGVTGEAWGFLKKGNLREQEGKLGESPPGTLKNSIIGGSSQVS